MSAEMTYLTPHLYQYLRNVSLREPDVLKKLREETHTLSNYMMQISPEQGQFMGLLLELMGAKRTLDIGTFTGYSALIAALALPDEGHVIACDVNEEWTRLAKKYWLAAQVMHKVDLRLAPALDTLQTLIDQGNAGTFDFAFIDADKANYSSYYEMSLILVRQGGLIAIDNVLWDGDVAKPEVKNASTEAIRAFNEIVFHDARVTMSLVPIGDGLTLARKR